jgi:hypothetical protein
MLRSVRLDFRTLGVFLLCLLCLVAGGGNVATAGDKEDIVGRWDSPSSDKAYIRFNADGTFKDVYLLGSTEGKYRILSKEIIELDTPGALYGRNVSEVKFKLDGDTLELKVYGQWVKYKRVK